MRLLRKKVDPTWGLPPTRGYGWCGLCRKTWAHVKGHTTRYNASQGCFPLCEECWEWLGEPSRRIPFYYVLMEQWDRQTPDQPISTERRTDILAAVWAGK